MFFYKSFDGKYNLCRRIASQDLLNDWFRDGCPLDWRKKRGFFLKI